MKAVASILIIFGVILIAAGVLEYYGWLKPPEMRINRGTGEIESPSGIIAALLEIIQIIERIQEEAPWVAVTGLVLVLFGVGIIVIEKKSKAAVARH